MPKLTKRVVDAAARPTGRDRFIWDSELPGFGLRIFASGKKSYLIQYRRSGRTRRYTIGLHGKFTPEEARRRASKLLAGVADGGDPAERRITERTAVTVAELVGLYFSEGPVMKPLKKESSWTADASNIRRHILPLLGRKVAKSLTQADVARFQHDVAIGKTATDEKTGPRGRAIVEGGKGTAARSLGVLRAMLQFGVARGLLADNPAKGVQQFKQEKKERFLSSAELARLGDALAKAEREGANPSMVAAVRLLLLTGARKNEILHLQWDYVDFEHRCIRLPDSKTGARSIPLGAAAVELLARLPRRSKFVLPASRGDGHIVGLQKFWEKLRKSAGLDGVRVHDCRHSFASVAVAGGDSLFLVGKVLGHRQARTTEKYAHLHDDPVRAVADRASRKIVDAMAGKSGDLTSVVVLKR